MVTGRKAPRVSPASRSHIVVDAGGDITLCGIRTKRLHPDAGTTMAHWVQMHINGHDPLWCRGCAVEYVKHPQAYWPLPERPWKDPDAQ